jgi:hypothetical protein
MVGTQKSPQISEVQAQHREARHRGAERYLLGMKLARAGTWLVEAHSPDIYARLVEKFRREGFLVSKIPYVNRL